jgi:AcrR family transcriptional regulator
VLPPSDAPAARQRVLEAALKLFARAGYHGASTRELTQALEMQPSALYAHFDSKEAVLAELVEHGYSAHQRALRAALLEVNAKPAEQIAALVRANARFHATYPLLAVVVHEEVHALPEKRTQVVSLLQLQTLTLLTEVVQRGVDQKVFDPPDLMTTVAAIGAMALRIPYWFEPGKEFDVERLCDAQVALALRVLGAGA